MRRYALAALVAVVVGFWALGEHENDTWRGIKMYKRVAKTDRSHPVHKLFGNHGDIYEVEYTDEFKRYMQQAPEFNPHRQGIQYRDGQGEQYAATATALWVNPVMVGRTAGITIELDTVNKKSKAAIVTDATDPLNKRILWWIFALCTSPTSRKWASQNTYMDEHIHWVSADGKTSASFSVLNVLLDKSTGCGTGYMEQSLTFDPSMNGTWTFSMMYLHAANGDNPEGETSSKWVPVYDYRNENYQCEIVLQ